MTSPTAATMSAIYESLSSLAASESGFEQTSASAEDTASVSASATASVTASAPPAASSGLRHKHWWDWFTDKADEIEEWVDDFVHKHDPLDEEKNNDKQGS
jgi:hypothetical protein